MNSARRPRRCRCSDTPRRRFRDTSPRKCAGSRAEYRSSRCAPAGKKFQPRWRWRIRLCALYWVATAMRRMPELRRFESAKSMMRDLPPKVYRGLARRSVNSISRLPRPRPEHTPSPAARASRSVSSSSSPFVVLASTAAPSHARPFVPPPEPRPAAARLGRGAREALPTRTAGVDAAPLPAGPP